MGWVENAGPEVAAASQWPTIVAICIVLSLASMAVVCCRLWMRATARGLASDDCMAALSMVFALAYSVLCIVQTKYGLGLPLKQRPAASILAYTRVNFAGRPIYQLGISFFKVALLISYLRLLKGTDQQCYRRVVWATIAVIFLAHLGCALSLILACSPVDKSWTPGRPGTCLAPGPSFTGYAVVTIVSDVVVALLPIPVLLRLRVRVEKKLGLMVIFMLGLFTTLCSVLRYLQINRIQHGDGNSTMLVLWGVIEFNVGNMVSSLPFLAPVCMKKAKEYRSKYSASGDGSSPGRKHSEHHELSDVGKNKSALASTTKSASEENILQGQAILKSVTYSVQVDDGADADADDDDAAGRTSSSRRRRHEPGSGSNAV